MELSRRLKTSDGFLITAAHTISKGERVVLWLHGITEGKDEYLGFFKDGAKYLKEKGIDSLRIDFRGHGNSSGSSLEFSILGQSLDTECAIQFLYKKYGEIFIVGCSFGAPPAIFSAIRHPKIVKKIILIAPVLSYEKTFLSPELDWGRSIFNTNAFKQMNKSKQIYLNEKFPVSFKLVEEMRIIYPDLAIKKVKQEISIIHGDRDTMVPFNVSLELSKNTPNIHFFPFKNMDHGFTDFDDELGNSIKSNQNKNKIFGIIQRECFYEET